MMYIIYYFLRRILSFFRIHSYAINCHFFARSVRDFLFLLSKG